MAFKVALAVCVMVAVAAAVPGAAPGGGWGGWGGLGGGWGGPPGGGWGALAAGGLGGAGGAGGAGAGAVNPWIPPWISQAPWYPQWGPCTMIGTTCLDCNTKLVCTKVGGLQRACTDPTLPHCNLGECSATPTDECAAVAAPVEVEA